MEQSLAEVPKDTLTLMRSARIEPPELSDGSVRVTMGYGYGDEVNPETLLPGSEYAVPVHERTEARHAPPTKAGFLLGPVLEHASELGPTMAASIRIALRSGGRMPRIT